MRFHFPFAVEGNASVVLGEVLVFAQGSMDSFQRICEVLDLGEVILDIIVLLGGDAEQDFCIP